MEQAGEDRGARDLHARRSSASRPGIFMTFRGRDDQQPARSGSRTSRRSRWRSSRSSSTGARTPTSSSSGGSSPGAARSSSSSPRWRVVAKLEKPPKRIVNVNGDTVFFPSSSETFDQGLLDGKKLAANEYCQECHPDSFHQWERSAHRFSSFNNPFYRKSVELMADRVGRERTKWCSGCHDPGRSLHRADGRGDPGEVLVRLLGGAAGPDLHVLPLDRRDQGRPRQRLLRHRGVQAVSVRVLEERDAPRRSTGSSSGWSRRSTARRS